MNLRVAATNINRTDVAQAGDYAMTRDAVTT